MALANCHKNISHFLPASKTLDRSFEALVGECSSIGLCINLNIARVRRVTCLLHLVALNMFKLHIVKLYLSIFG